MSVLCFPNLLVERPMQDDVFLFNSQRSNDQAFLKFYEKLAMGRPSRLPPNSSKNSARAEDPIITVSTRC